MAKIYVLDTSVLIHDPHSIKTFEECRVIIPLTVLAELDSLKAGQNQTSHAAREASRIIDSIRESGQKLTEFSLLQGTTVRVRILRYDKSLSIPDEMDLSVKDNQIIATALTAKAMFPEDEVIMVSKDTVLRLVAESVGMDAEDYKKDKVSSSYVFGDSSVKVTMLEEEYKELVERGVLENKRFESIKDHALISTEFPKIRKGIIVKQSRRNGQEMIHELKVIKTKDVMPYELQARNTDQLYALYLLMEPAVKIVTLSGLAGSGKSICILAAGLELVLEKQIFKRMVVIRPTISIGEELGFLPGSLDDKLEPWMQPVHDNVEQLHGEEDSNNGKADILFENGTIEVAALSFLRGRTINNAFIYIDEAQNISPRNLKSAISRAGSKTKVVIAGDIDQIDTSALDKYSCGLAVVAEKFKDEKIAGHAILTKSERSKIAEMAATLL